MESSSSEQRLMIFSGKVEGREPFPVARDVNCSKKINEKDCSEKGHEEIFSSKKSSDVSNVAKETCRTLIF